MAAKRRQRGSGSIRKRGRALYLRYRPPGQQRQTEQHFPRLPDEGMKDYRARAEEELTKITLGLAAGSRIAPTTRTVQDLADTYLASISGEVKARTLDGYEAALRNYVLPVFGHRKVAHLTTDDIRAYKRHLLERRVVGGRTMAVSTARRAMTQLHDLLNYAMDGEESRQYWGIGFDPWPKRRFRWPDERDKPAPHTYQPYTVDEVRRFIAATPQPLQPHMLSVILLMLRDGELRAMRWANLDEDAGLYFVRETHSRRHGFTTTKTASSEAQVPVPRILLSSLTEHHKRQAEHRLKSGTKWQDEGLIFTTGTGSPLHHCWFNERLKFEIAERAGIRPVSLHTLRKTGASILESSGVSRAETQEALRHKRVSVTDGYVSVYMDQRRQHMEEVAMLITDDLPAPQTSLKVA